ncbi:NAD(P)/FAD-dependent oxidoreductase [Candidatus Solincola tengchongensis]|uniref:NAD(P)/FAD-dependent oxidoreductase n=1 Tax=Candidatus Solincola tengchongensis TaxID=2900693 RepID=UPI00257C4C80|nr:NAD(P)/FAD-dependent oxidoreductase [Candidatus Solincola tengchongensis]
MHYDVAVVGAGPAGCMAARELASRGFKVLLLDKYGLPREKACMGLLSPEGRRLLEEGFGPLPAECLAEPAEALGVKVLSDGGGEYLLPFSGEGLWVRRASLDAFLARACGAEVRDGCRVTEVTVGRFYVRIRFLHEDDEEEAEATYLVGADGAESLVARMVRPEFYRLHTLPALERTVLVLWEGEADWDSRWLGMVALARGEGLGRFFVRAGTVGMAVSCGEEHRWQRELDTLSEFLSRRIGLALRGEPVRMLSVSNRMARGGRFNLGAGSALLAGEAAGFLDPWGFGIRLALESGKLAGECIADSAGENVTPHLHYLRRARPVLEMWAARGRKRPAGMVGELDLSPWSDERGRTARRDLRSLRRRLGR